MAASQPQLRSTPGLHVAFCRGRCHTTDIRHISLQDVVAKALSLIESSLRPHHMTHWPHRKMATTSSEHSWGQSPPYDWRNYQSPATRSPSTATPLLGDLNCTFQLPYCSKCSNPFMICRTRAPKQWQSWSHDACGRIAAPGDVLVRPASTPKSPVTW
jgi:hypothetical protein